VEILKNPGVQTGVGDGVGLAVGNPVGDSVGAAVGPAVGAAVGPAVGAAVGPAVGAAVGPAVGVDVGDAVGNAVGAAVGAAHEVPVFVQSPREKLARGRPAQQSCTLRDSVSLLLMTSLLFAATLAILTVLGLISCTNLCAAMVIVEHLIGHHPELHSWQTFQWFNCPAWPVHSTLKGCKKSFFTRVSSSATP
jgi:hypothetical protein